jgi:hypothetical protein
METHASPKRQPIFREVTWIFLPRPYHLFRRGTIRSRMIHIKTSSRSKRTGNERSLYPNLLASSWPNGPLPRLRARILTLYVIGQIGFFVSHGYGMDPPGIIPSSCVHILNPRKASSSVATTYFALPESFK